MVERQHSGSVWRPSPPPIKGLRMAHPRANARSRKRTPQGTAVGPPTAKPSTRLKEKDRKRTWNEKVPSERSPTGQQAKPSQAKNPRTQEPKNPRLTTPGR